MIAPDDPRHGTYAGAMAGCRGKQACEPCRRAVSDYRKRMLHDLHNGHRRLIDSTGYRRRVQALQAIGWSVRMIADRLGEHYKHTHHRATRCAKVSRRHQAALCKVYDELSMTPGPSIRSIRLAERRGWLPPLAWDDETIDDPNAKPYSEPKALKRDLPIDEVAVQRALLGDHVPLTRQERHEVVKRWQAAGKSLTELDRIHGWNAQRDLREMRSAA